MATTTTSPLETLESDPALWRYTLFPSYTSGPDGLPVASHPEHDRLWEYLWKIRRGERLPAFVGIWFRGAAKSTNVEMGLCAVGARRARRYAWYISATQDQADDHVETIGEMLTSPIIGAYYPSLATRRVGKYGPRAWRKNRVTTAAGFTVDAIGLDVAVRGRRVGEDRPDLIVLDDIDDAHDGPTTRDNKITAITRKLLPAGSVDLIVIAIQNLIRTDGFFGKMNSGEADYLLHRIMSGPVPAVEDLEVSEGIHPETGDPRYVITGGRASWVGFDLETAQAKMDEEGYSSFLLERQHSTRPPGGGMFDHLNLDLITVDEDEIPELIRTTTWVDPAISNTDGSDSYGIQTDGLGIDGRIYRLYSWEQITSPVDALEKAILSAVYWGSPTVGIETDQGGDAWESVYAQAVQNLISEGRIRKAPRMVTTKAARQRTGDSGSRAQRSKVGRASKMLTDYETGKIRHLRGTVTAALNPALHRFPRTKPLDLVDTSYWAWADLRNVGEIFAANEDHRVRTRAGPTTEDDPYAADRQSRWR